jgi:hypothetical protein
LKYSLEDYKGVMAWPCLLHLPAEADINKNNLVELRELYKYVYRGVSTETNGQQHPELKGTFDNKLPLSIIK